MAGPPVPEARSNRHRAIVLIALSPEGCVYFAGKSSEGRILRARVQERGPHLSQRFSRLAIVTAVLITTSLPATAAVPVPATITKSFNPAVVGLSTSNPIA